MFVYVITCLVNGKRYVGKANMPAQRWTAHQTVARTGKGQTPLYVEMREFGLEAFAFEVVEQCESEEQSFDAERIWIRKLRSDDLAVGYNLTSGGQGLTGASEETRRKMSAAKRGKIQDPSAVARRAETLRANGKKAAAMARAVELHKQGLCGADIAREIGRSRQRVYELLKEAGIQGPGTGQYDVSLRKRCGASRSAKHWLKPENAEALRRMHELRSQGVSVRAIAAELGMSHQRISQLLRMHMGLEQPCDSEAVKG